MREECAHQVISSLEWGPRGGRSERLRGRCLGVVLAVVALSGEGRAVDLRAGDCGRGVGAVDGGVVVFFAARGVGEGEGG